jgi:type VI secretion system protein ImpC
MADTQENLSLVDQCLIKAKMALDPSQKDHAIELLKEFVAQVEKGGAAGLPNAAVFINKRIQEIDDVVSNQVNEVLHHIDFQKLEASWRGLHFLVSNTECGSRLKLRLLNATKKELLEDLEKALEFDQSSLFKKIYEEEYGTFGGHPYSCLMGDYEFSRLPQDQELLRKISGVAAAAHAPFISAADPKLFHMESFESLSTPRDLSKLFESSDMAAWRSFRQSEDSRYVTLVLPHVLMRLPYGPETVPVEGLNFVEKVDGVNNSKFCWGNAAYALAQRITHAFASYGWTAAIRGVEGGGLVEALPAYTFKSSDGDVILKCPTEVTITDRREKELSDLGFIALCHCKGTDYAAFFGGQTSQEPKVYNLADATANANLSARLPYILASSRFAHYVKSIMRDKIGSFMTRNDVAIFLNNWIANYVLLNDGAPQAIKAQYPLREARIDVEDVPGKPGSYRAIIYLRPHFQLEEFTASIRLVANLPKPAGA